MRRVAAWATLGFLALAWRAPGGEAQSTTRPARGDSLLAAYFRDQTTAIANRCLSDVKTSDDWNARKQEYRRQLADMLGLWPAPARTDLKPVITGKLDQSEFTVERLQFQSMPRLYVTGDLYLPKALAAPAPAILYVCGHSEVKKNGVSFGNKTAYQHHGEWFARNGYVCLVIDTLQLGEIEGIHHGTYREGMWWWHSRGYTPAGVEAWNGIRALDYLTSRPEVDANRIGMTGRSGGGAYTWWVAALDDRVKVACPVAGITDLQNHVVDGCIEGHCDCMFMVNTYRWDFPLVAALVAPRPLLICNSDKDTIFPFDGVYRLHEKVRRIYRLLNADQNLGLLITEGPHKDTQDLQVPVFRWFNRFLKNDLGTVDKVATSFFQPEQLKVFDTLPDDQINTRIQETFVPMAPAPQVPQSAEAWAKQRDHWMTELREKTFGGWPDASPPLNVTRAFSSSNDGVRFSGYDFLSQHDVPLRLYVAEPQNALEICLNVLGEDEWNTWLAAIGVGFESQFTGEALPPPDSNAFDRIMHEVQSERRALAWIATRGMGPTAWDPRKDTHIRRRFVLLGQTVDGMRVWDVRRAIQAIRSVPDLKSRPICLRGDQRMAGIALYASLFEPNIARLELADLPPSHRSGPDLLNVLRILDIPAAVAMAAERCDVTLHHPAKGDWSFPSQVRQSLNWPESRLVLDR